MGSVTNIQVTVSVAQQDITVNIVLMVCTIKSISKKNSHLVGLNLSLSVYEIDKFNLKLKLGV